MSSRPSRMRAVCVAIASAAAGATAVSLPAPSADAVGVPLTAAEVVDVVARCVEYSKHAPGKPQLAIAVVDAESNSLGVFRMTGAPVGAVAAALAKAGTASYFSSDDQTFSTRTAAFIIQDHFPPGVRFQPGGPLYGVEFSSIATTDVNRIFYPPFPAARGAEEAETRVRGDLGGVALYKNGRKVGGLGIDDGDLRKRISIPDNVFPGPDCGSGFRLTFANMERGRALEEIALAAARGRLAPKKIRSDTILVGGIRLPYSRGSSLRSRKAPPLATGDDGDGDWDPDFPPTDGVPVPSRFVDTVIDPPTTAGADATSFAGQIPVGRPPVGAADGSPTAEEVNRILWQGAERANITRGAIRRPIGLPMQCWITVVDAHGALLGAFRFAKDATLFSYDVAVQKARTAVMFSDESAAFSSRAVGLLSQAFYPAGQQNSGRGPLFQLQDGITVGLLGGAFATDDGEGGSGGPDPRIANGITIFPGGVPIYRDGKLIGGVGVSGDGVDQDDIVADYASRGFGAPPAIRCDGLSAGALKAGLRRALDRIDAIAPADPGVCDTLRNKAATLFRARFDTVVATLARTDLDVAPSYVKHPRHPGPVTIRR
jgi:uncharacterized protein GlcG (DUF336 family)